MTCIIGLIDEKTKKIYMGGDSGSASGWIVRSRMDEKLFRNGPFLIGFTTSWRMGQLLRYCLKPPNHPSDLSDMDYMVQVFVPAVIKCFQEGGFNRVESGISSAGQFLVGYKTNLYEIGSDYQVSRLYDGLTAIGCGYEIALGAMFALSKLPPEKRILKSLEIVTKINAAIKPPFIVEQSE